MTRDPEERLEEATGLLIEGRDMVIALALERDALKLALAPVARELHAWREREPCLVGEPIAICLDPEEIEAILKVAGGEG